jgi:hypothetical protein
MVFKNNGPGNCCCEFCPEYPNSLRVYTDAFDDPLFTGWQVVSTLDEESVWLFNNMARFGANDGFLINYFKCETHSGLTINVEANCWSGEAFGDDPNNSRVGIFARPNGDDPFAGVALEQWWYPLGPPPPPDPGEHYLCRYPPSQEFLVSTPEEGDRLRILVLPTPDDYIFTVLFYVNDIIIHSAYPVPINFNDPGDDPPPCKIEIGVFGGNLDLAIPTLRLGYADDFYAYVTCDGSPPGP